MTDRQLPTTDIPDFSRRGPDVWSKYQSAIGSLPWEWKADEPQKETRPNQQSGTLSCRIEKLPKDIQLDILIEAVEWLVDDKAVKLVSPEAVTLSVHCDARHKFTSNIGIDFDAPKPKKKIEAAPAGGPYKYKGAGSNTSLDKATFYRSSHEGNRVYGFIPRTAKLQTIKLLPRERGITFNGPISMNKDGVQGARITIDESCVEALQLLTKVWPTAKTSDAQIEGPSQATAGVAR